MRITIDTDDLFNRFAKAVGEKPEDICPNNVDAAIIYLKARFHRAKNLRLRNPLVVKEDN